MLGIALGGGGTKGSYQLGAWLAFRELNINFDVVTGVSIGSLNAFMMIEDDFEKCNHLWNNVEVTNIIKDGFDIEEFNLVEIMKHNDFKPFVKKYFKDKGADIVPFKQMVWSYADFNKIKNSEKKYGVILSSFPMRRKEEVYMNTLSDGDMFNALIASCSLFPIFPTAQFNNKQYIDGGYSDNLPIEFNFRLGSTKVVAIDLDDKITHKEYLNNPYVTYIYPKWDLGSCLYFNKDVINRNKLLGYYDTLKAFNKYEGFKYTFNIDENYLNLAKIITLNILNDSIYINNNNLRKPRSKSIITFMNEHINRKINDYDYFLKAIENLGEIYDINPCINYNTNEFINIIFEEINKEKDLILIEELPLIKSEGRKKEYINNYDKKKFVNFLYNNKFDFDFKIFLLQNNFSLYIALIFFESVGKTNEIQLHSK
ncbi:MAG: patatin-like phospholipase family protein [bacterium]